MEKFQAYHKSAVCDATSSNGSEAKGHNDAVSDLVDHAHDAQNTARHHLGQTTRQEPTHARVVQPRATLGLLVDVVLGLIEHVVLVRRGCARRRGTTMQGRCVSLGALSAVSRPAVLVATAGGIGGRAVCLVGRHRHERGSFVGGFFGISSAGVGEDQRHDDLRAYHPGRDPADLVVGVVLV